MFQESDSYKADQPPRVERSVPEHAARIAHVIQPLLQLREPALGMCTEFSAAGDLIAAVNSPAFPMSAMDGFAVRTTDLAASQPGHEFDVQGVVYAGAQEHMALAPQMVVQIMTGAPVPLGADAVVPIELTSAANTPPSCAVPSVSFRSSALEKLSVGRHVRGVGDEFFRGEALCPVAELNHGTRLGLAAAAGASDLIKEWRAEFEAWRSEELGVNSLTVGIIVTGEELAPLPPSDHGAHLLPHGAVYESNSVMLQSLLSHHGVVTESVVVSDRREDFERELIDLASRNDFIITTGGVSQGSAEVVRDCLEVGRQLHPRVGESEFVPVAVHPGRPQGLGRVNVLGVLGEPVPVISFPGTPIGVWVSFELFLRPLLGAWGEPGALGDGQLPLFDVNVLPRPDSDWHILMQRTATPAVYRGAPVDLRGGGFTLLRVAQVPRANERTVTIDLGTHLAGFAQCAGFILAEPGKSPGKTRIVDGDRVTFHPLESCWGVCT